MITKKNKEVLATGIAMLGFAFLIFGSVVTNYKHVDAIYLFLLIVFIIKYFVFVEVK